MPDPRFYEDLGPVTAADLAALCGARVADAAAGLRLIHAVAPLGRADDKSVSYLAHRRYEADLAGTGAAACFVTADRADRMPPNCMALVTDRPQAAYARAADRLHRLRGHDPGSPAVHPTAVLEEGVRVHHGVVIGPGARVGRGAELGPGCAIGPGVAIGRDCSIGPNCTIGAALIGDHVRILAGAVIGEAGFGVAGGENGLLDAPHLGRVIIQDGVSIGAGACLDRGAWDDTVIGENTKIDNMVQIAHNVRLGRNCMVAGQVGLAGSVVVGDGAMFGGQAGVADHVKIGAGAQIAAGAGVMEDVPPGERWCGYPARPIRRFMRETVWLARMAGKRGGARGNES